MSSITPLPRHQDLAPTPHLRPAPDRLYLSIGADNAAHAERLAQHLGAVYGLPVAQEHDAGEGLLIRFATPGDRPATDLEPAQVEGQEYALAIAEDEVVVTSSGVGGWHHGIAVLRRLVAPADAGTWAMSLGAVTDAPDLAWRGFSLDIARSFFPLAEMNRLVDLLAAYRFNVLHLHLTDDQGWRLESTVFPTLTALSGPTAVDGGRAGFLTQAEFASLQATAAARGITVVPEIDMPGHTNAALHALPELTKDGTAASVYTGVEVGFSRIHTDVPATLPFLTAIFAELATLTTGRYLHFGGDEAHQVPGEDYAQLVEHAIGAITAVGKVPVGWQEIAAADLPADAIMQLWDRRKNPPEIAAQSAAGRRSILSPSNRAYLDMSARPGQGIGVNWDTEFSLREAYDWDPRSAVEGLAPETVLGVEATMWSEYVHDFDTLTTLVLPRVVATAEVGWTPLAGRAWEDFLSRVRVESSIWADAGVAFDQDGFDNL